MQAIESLRGLLDECEGGGDGLKTAIDTRSSPPPTARQRRAGVTAAAARAGREGTGADGDNDDDDADTSRQPSEAVAVDGQLARVARGRLEWLIWRLRGHLSSELASALRQADPLAAGGGSETQGRRGQGSGDGARLSNVDEERRRKGFAGVKVRRAHNRGRGRFLVGPTYFTFIFCLFFLPVLRFVFVVRVRSGEEAFGWFVCGAGSGGRQEGKVSRSDALALGDMCSFQQPAASVCFPVGGGVEHRAPRFLHFFFS